jgi:CRP/FNR family transcriptional regulator, cyclic AMP receptor protein
MVSPELLRRYPFFAGLSDAQLREISMISEEENFDKNSTLIEECEPAQNLYLLVDGSIDLFYRSVDELNLNPAPPKELTAGEVNPGEIFGVCAMVEPYFNNTTARTAVASRVIIMNGPQLRKLLDEDMDLSNKILKRIVHGLMDQLVATRVQLAAAQS